MNNVDDYINKAFERVNKAFEQVNNTMTECSKKLFSSSDTTTVYTSSSSVGTEDWRSPIQHPNSVLEYKIPLPGFAPSEVQVSFIPQMEIEIRAQNTTAKKKLIIKSAISINPATINAVMKHGLLTVLFQQRETEQKNKIKIDVQNK